MSPFYWEPKHELEEKISERIDSRPFRKVGCNANINAQKMLSKIWIFIRLDSSHTGHGMKTLDAWCLSKIRPPVRRWLHKVVATEIDWKSFKKMVRPEDHRLEFLGVERINLGEPLEVSETMLIDAQGFYNFH